MPIEEIERFKREFISLFALARRPGEHFLVVKKELKAVGVKLAMDPKKVGATQGAFSTIARR